MKLYIKLFSFLLTLGIIFSCGSKKSSVSEDEVVQNLPCFGENYFSTKKSFVASAIGESLDQMTARKKAFANARQELATNINSTLSIVGDNYVKSSEYNNVEEVLEQFQNLSRTVVEQKLSGIVLKCEINTKSKSTGNYKYYLAIELGSEDVLNNLAETLSNDKVLKIDYNYQKFKETFEKEMQKLNNSN